MKVHWYCTTSDRVKIEICAGCDIRLLQSYSESEVSLRPATLSHCVLSLSFFLRAILPDLHSMVMKFFKGVTRKASERCSRAPSPAVSNVGFLDHGRMCSTHFTRQDDLRASGDLSAVDPQRPSSFILDTTSAGPCNCFFCRVRDDAVRLLFYQMFPN
jgi:hypothetical protein